MTAPVIGWRGGEAALHRRVERALAAALADPEPIHASARRTLYRLTLEPIAGEQGAFEGAEVVCKLFHRRHGMKALRETLKLQLRQSAAQREWNALLKASARGLAVPTPLAFGRISSREEVLVMSFVPGRPLLEVLANEGGAGETRAGTDGTGGPTFEAWEAVCGALARSVGALHDAGLRHGDLHAGNLIVGEEGIVLLDFQRCRPLRSVDERLADLAQLEFSLSRSGASHAMCAALRRACGVGPELDRAILRFVRDYRRGRARRLLRIGRNWERITTYPNARGAMLTSVDFGLVHECFFSIDLSAEGGDPAEEGVREIRRTERVQVHEMEAWDRRVVTKRVRAGNPLRVIADRFRGSAAARAFRRARADQLISDRAAEALAYIDVRKRGWPVESWLLMERVGDCDLDQLVPADAHEAREISSALGEWLAEQHAIGLSHRDLKGGNIRVERDGDSIRFWLVDLQDLTGPDVLPEGARLEALVQLNASLADEVFDAASRRAALAAYTERLPFSRPRDEIEREIVRRSLARRHRFRAQDCSAR